MLPSETMIWQPEFTDKTLSRKPGAVQSDADIADYKLYISNLLCLVYFPQFLLSMNAEKKIPDITIPVLYRHSRPQRSDNLISIFISHLKYTISLIHQPTYKST
ncbi:putative integrase [Escherichia coli]|nr:putative integrase [Escherichia coli]